VATVRKNVERLLAEGMRPARIARELSVAGPTVEYHVQRIRAEALVEAPQSEAYSPPTARTQISTRHRVAQGLAEGLSRAEIARELGVTKSTVSYHARRLGAPVDSRCARRYDWGEIQSYYDLGHSVRECRLRFGFSNQTWNDAVKREAVRARPAALPFEKLLVAGTHRNRFNIKQRLLRHGLKEHRCEECGLTDWRGRPLPLALHHVNGDRRDNRLENLLLLCGNCHSQTDTFAGRNRKRAGRDGNPQRAA